jgi:hypothetical protein
MLNAGHRRGAVAGRCVTIGKKVMPEEIPAYCAVALAGLHELPDTISSRSILIQMVRRAPDEHVEPFRPRTHAPQAKPIRDGLAAWSANVADTLKDAGPVMPVGVDDRDADCWEALLAIADAAGGDWPERARAAAVNLVASGLERAQTTGVQLLSDLYDVFEGVEKMATEVVLKKLIALPESAWAEFHGKPLNDRGLANRLRKYAVKPKKIRIGEVTARGYLAGDLYEPWRRYVLPYRQKPEHAEHAEQDGLAPGTLSTTRNINTPHNRQKWSSVPDVPDVPDFQGVPYECSRLDDLRPEQDTLRSEQDTLRPEQNGDDGDPFASFHDPSLKLNMEEDDYPELPVHLDRRG